MNRIQNKKNKQAQIFFLGPAGSYAEVAADYFGAKFSSVKTVPKSSILHIIESLDKESYTENTNEVFGVVPVENSIEGIVRETLDNLVKTVHELHIIGEVIIPISHCLLSKSNETGVIRRIKKIISKDQAIAQCRSYIAANMSEDVQKINAPSTSDAARQLLELTEDCAAIASVKAAQIYGLNILAQNINDENDNLTRFVLLGRDIHEKTGNDKTSIAFSAKNQPGSLVDILCVFKEFGINLSYIESRPSKKVFGEYNFFIDFDGHIQDEIVKSTIEKIKPLKSFYRFLGSYAKFSYPLGQDFWQVNILE